MDFAKNNKLLIFLLFLTTICLFLSTGRYSTFFLDVGREMYYPYAILKGEVLYKDLFCIYGPFSYLFNAFLYKIFGAKLSSLYIGGVVSSYSVIVFTYLISKKFLNNFLTFAIVFFVIATGCLATRIFNFTLPYSYAVMYGLVCFLVSVYFLISFIETKKNGNLFISCVFCSFAILNKYDFVLFLIPLFFTVFKTKNLKIILKSLLALFLPIFFSFLILFLSGLEIKNLIDSISDIKAFTNTNALKIFYSTQGVYYSKNLWGNWLLTFSNRLFCFSIIYLGFVFLEKKKFLKYLGGVFVLTGAVLTAFFTTDTSYLWLTFLVFLLFLFRFLKNDFCENVFIISSLFVGLKSFWGLSHVNYGLYYIPFVLISFFILLKKFSPKISKSLAVLFISMGLSFSFFNLIELSSLDKKIDTNKGFLKTSLFQSKITNGLLSFTNGIEIENPTVMVFPEGLNINFLSKKEISAKGKYNSLIPLYTEGFGEDTIIEYYKDKPEYIIFVNIPMSSYGKEFICESYGEKFCGFVGKNYVKIEENSEYKNIFKIYKRADI